MFIKKSSNMENEIIELLNKQKKSDEISKILNIDKIKVDLFLIEYYYKCNPDPRRINIELIKSGIIDKNKNNKLSNIEIGNKYHFNSTIFGKILIKSGIKFRNSHYKNISILTKENIDIIINKFNRGITIKSIADDFNLNQDIISKLLKNIILIQRLHHLIYIFLIVLIQKKKHIGQASYMPMVVYPAKEMMSRYL